MSIARDAALSASLFAVNPEAMGGVCLRSQAQPAREQWLDMLRDLLPPQQSMRRIPCNISDDRLLGGMDLGATLKAGRAIGARGVLAESNGGIIIVSMAERLSRHTAASLSAALDTGEVSLSREGLTFSDSARVAIVALDESLGEDQFVPPSLTDRLSLWVDLRAVVARCVLEVQHDQSQIRAARLLLPRVEANYEIRAALCIAALKLGVLSPRVSVLALQVARAAAALDSRTDVKQEDASVAARLVLAPRAAQLPQTQSAGEQTESDAENRQPAESEAHTEKASATPDDDEAASAAVTNAVVAAAAAAIPKDLLAVLTSKAASDRHKSRSVGRSGALGAAAGRGRPVGIRNAAPQRGARLNLSATLRAAAPWQTLRGRNASDVRVRVAASDLRVTNYKQRRRTLTIFTVDASGSAALNRLAEAKGAVELLLAECYIRRDLVAVISFRVGTAEILLPPTRSLVRAKRSLAGLPGGGGTPLAAAIEAAGLLAKQAQRRGETPSIVFLSDGRANVSRSGAHGREAAHEDAMGAAQFLRRLEVAALFVDTSTRPCVQAQAIASAMAAKYVPLPYVNARALNEIVKQTARPQ